MGVMDFFRQAKAPEPLSSAAQAEDAKKAAEAAAAAANKGDDKKGPESPLDKFAEVFKIDDKSGDGEAPIFNIDPVKLTEQAQKTNFVNSIPPEALAEMAKGGEEGVKAALGIINNVAQSGYAQSTLVSARLVEHALKQQREQFENVVIPQMMRQLNAQQNLADTNPALSHPAIAPVVAAVRDQLARQHPDATPKEISAMAQDFMTAFATAVNPPKDVKQQSGKEAKETDWSTFLSS